MIYLALSILCSSIINLVFKLFDKYKIDILPAIVFNYFTCSIVGQSLSQTFIFGKHNINQPYFIFAIVLGLLFVLIFYAMAKTTALFGVGVNAVSAKMGFIFPTIFFFLFLQEQIGILQFLAIILAIIAVWFMKVKDEKVVKKQSFWFFPILVFIGSGIIDSSLKWLDISYGTNNNSLLVSTTIFSSAAILGTVIIVPQWQRINGRNIIAGICLGIPNLFSIYFLLLAIKQLKGLSTGAFFAVNNVGVILISTLAAVVLLKEQLKQKQWIGLIISLISILLIAYVV